MQGGSTVIGTAYLKVRLCGCRSAAAIIRRRVLLQVLPDREAQSSHSLCCCRRRCSCSLGFLLIVWANCNAGTGPAAGSGGLRQGVQGAQQCKQVLHSISGRQLLLLLGSFPCAARHGPQ